MLYLPPSFAIRWRMKSLKSLGFYFGRAKTAKYNRLGYTLANEFSDHINRTPNYLYLAHSKIGPASFGLELLVGGTTNAYLIGHSRS